ncbi:tetratricopeptide repeat protein [Aeromonas caviae]|uniref:tetratricopeptide repeat protein n=1 Tax=Aeromonas TaxID=642 RepID=UPI001FD22CD3|nr:MULTISPECIES: tetratricopeptide repeat protein [Aeromonas]MCJ7928118.1 tetratricopeptide repeat protein [Aeromonas sp. LsrichE-8G]MEA9416820.1 tetratricopeptide repeat protein [Aeromonas caviae]
MKQLNTLKAEGRLQEARQHGLLQLIEHPTHAELHYEVAGLHDMLGREVQAIPLYQKAVSLGLGESSLRGALLGLGSSYRTTGLMPRRWPPLTRPCPASPMPWSSRCFAP